METSWKEFVTYAGDDVSVRTRGDVLAVVVNRKDSGKVSLGLTTAGMSTTFEQDFENVELAKEWFERAAAVTR